MEPDLFFTLFNRAVIPAWLLLITAPNWQWTRKLVFHVLIPSLIAVVYIYAFLSNPVFSEEGDFN